MTTYNNIKIVLADDDEDDRELFVEAISHPGVTITTAVNGKELMKWLEAVPELPDCVFIDLNMPEKSGKECLVEIRDNERLRSLPVIIYSTSSSRKDIEETFALGANLYVVKPGSFKALCDTLNRILQMDWKNVTKVTSSSEFLYEAS